MDNPKPLNFDRDLEKGASDVAFDLFPLNSAMRFNVATRTRKNSSILLEKMPRNLILSRRGTVGSAASCKTRPLNANQLISRAIVFLLIGSNIIPVFVREQACSKNYPYSRN